MESHPALAEELVLESIVTQAMIGGTICKPGWARRFGRLFFSRDESNQTGQASRGRPDIDSYRCTVHFVHG
jgi:hypothetical protein